MKLNYIFIIVWTFFTTGREEEFLNHLKKHTPEQDRTCQLSTAGTSGMVWWTCFHEKQSK